jgi:tetratricopeptide (TPR) repeat protein
VFQINDANSKLLQKAIKDGNAVLLLGAGTSATSTNPRGEPVKLGRALAAALAEMSGFSYTGEPLPDVLEAVLGTRISHVQFATLLREEYTRIKPSSELSRLFQYSWKRVYTWNVDDAIENVSGSVQLRRYMNGLSDKVSAYEGIEYLQVIHLHGEAIKPEHGFMFTPKDYNARLNQDRHDWYRQAATDYAANIPIFIGSRLEEPILAAELDRARPSLDTHLGIAFLITPDDFTPLQLAGLAARNIVVIKAVLADFIQWLDQTLGSQIAPLTVLEGNSSFISALTARIVPTRLDVETATSIILHTWSDAKNKADDLHDLARTQAARAFLEGQPPTWTIAATDVPVWLTKTNELYKALMQAISARDRVFLVHGQSGSGKTTALLQALIKFMREHDKYAVYELKGDVKSLRASLELIHKLHKDDHAIVYIGDAFLYSDSLEEDVLAFAHGSLTLISSARSGEWRTHIERRIGEATTAFEFQRFVRGDYPALIERLLKYVPAPKFRRMSPEERFAKLASSREQLLIALKETTSSAKFTKVITDEYQELRHVDSRQLLLIAGLATVARTGISRGALREAFDRVKTGLTFEEAITSLEGIVSLNTSDRYVARHEIYIRHILENVASFQEIVAAAIEILRTYTKYNLPIVRNVSRLDGLLFKFLLNHNFLGDISRRRNEVQEGLRIYQTFEVDFQLDGQFWLQYGQYLAMFGQLEAALPILQKSIAAYPDNPYAVHALADLQLRVGYSRDSYDSETAELLADAAETLEAMHESYSLDVDYYPIVTLSEKYVGALIKHGRLKIATEAARRYYETISSLPRENEAMSRAKVRLAHFITQGRWVKEGDPSATESHPRKRKNAWRSQGKQKPRSTR